MARWIVFDELTAAELRTHVPKEAVFEAPGRTAIEYALTAPRTVVAVLGPPERSETTIAVFRPRRRPAARTSQVPAPVAASSPIASGPPVTSPATRASGFLGLSDHLVEPDEDQVETKKRRWQWWR